MSNKDIKKPVELTARQQAFKEWCDEATQGLVDNLNAAGRKAIEDNKKKAAEAKKAAKGTTEPPVGTSEGDAPAKDPDQ